MYNVRNLPKRCLSFAKYPLAVFFGYGMVTIYTFQMTTKITETFENLAAITPISLEWSVPASIPVTIDMASMPVAEEIIIEQPAEEITMTIEDAIDCSGFLTDSGASSFCYTYMCWQAITSEKSQQYAFRQEHFPNWNATYGCAEAFDEAGFARVDERFVVATTRASDGGLFEIGDKFTAILENGIEIPCIVGDVKSPTDPNWTPYGHRHGSGLSVLEFIVDKSMWYDIQHANPGTETCMADWKSPLVKLIKE